MAAIKLQLPSLLQEPLIISVTTVIIGTGIIGYLNYVRTRRDTIRDRSIDFIEFVSGSINPALSEIFGWIRQSNTGSWEKISHYRSELFKARLTVRTKSISYLDNETFADAYDELCWQIKHIEDIIILYDNGADKDMLITEIKSREGSLTKHWKFTIGPHGEDIPEFNSFVMNWNRMLWKRSVYLISTSTDAVLGKERPISYSTSPYKPLQKLLLPANQSR